MLTAITREVSASLGRCELTHLARAPIDVARARRQHEEYEAALRGLGVQVVRAPAQPDMPDAVFVEDAAVVLEEGAVMLRPGAASRRGEVAGVARVLRQWRELAWIEAPGTVDGGDVLRVGKTLHVGRTGRTNEAGLAQLRQLVRAWGYGVETVEVRGCLHLKSAATAVGEGLLLVNPAWLPGEALAGVERIHVDPAEPQGANGLLVNGSVIYPAHFPRTRQRLECRGVKVITVACDELAKAEGAVTCCSILVDTPVNHGVIP